jgi:hypothetical protein
MDNLKNVPWALSHAEMRVYLPSLGLPARRKLLAEFGVMIGGRRLVPTSKLLELLQAEPTRIAK